MTPMLGNLQAFRFQYKLFTINLLELDHIPPRETVNGGFELFEGERGVGIGGEHCFLFRQKLKNFERKIPRRICACGGHAGEVSVVNLAQRKLGGLGLTLFVLGLSHGAIIANFGRGGGGFRRPAVHHWHWSARARCHMHGGVACIGLTLIPVGKPRLPTEAGTYLPRRCVTSGTTPGKRLYRQ